MPEKPTINQIRNLAQRAKGHWAAFHQQADADFSLTAHGARFQLQSASGESYTSINPTTAKNKRDAAANHLIANMPRISIDKSAFPESEKPIADQLEQALQAVFWRAVSSSTADPHHGAAKNAAGMGMGVIEIAVDFSRMPDPEEKPQRPEKDATPEARKEYEQARREYEWKRKNAFPIVLRTVDPREIYADPGTDGERWIIRMQKMTVGEVMATFSAYTPPTGASDFDEVEVLEYWNPEWYYFEVDGRAISRIDALSEENEGKDKAEMESTDGPWQNMLGFIPYVICSSGYGESVGKPEERYQSLITGARTGNLFKAEAERYTQIHAIVEKMAWGAVMVPAGMGELDMSPGAQNEVQLDAQGRMPEVRVIGMVNPPTGIFAELRSVENAIDAATIPDILSSADSGAAESALKFVRKTQEALVNLGPLKRSMERLWERVFARLIMFFDNPYYFDADETVFVYGETPKGPVQAEIGPKLIKGRHVPVFVEIRPALPEDEAVRIQTGLAGVGRAWGLEDFYDKFGKWDNPQDMEKRFWKSQVKTQVVQSGVVGQFITAVLSGQANPLLGLKGFMQQQQGAAIGPENPPSAAERTPDNSTVQPTPVNAPSGTGNPGMLDMQDMIQRALLQRRARRPDA